VVGRPGRVGGGGVNAEVAAVDDLLSAMTATVRRVVAERPTLTKLTFCIPWNLPAGTAQGRRKPARQKYNEKVDTWKEEIPGAGQIEFELIQGSDLLARLALPQHAGRQWFWWNEPYLGPEWLANLQVKQIAYAGDRYRPELQVDLPIQEDLSALGFADSYCAELDRHSELAVRRLREVGRPPAESGDDMPVSAAAVAEATSALQRQVSSDYLASHADPLTALDQAVTVCAEALAKAQDDAQAARAALNEDSTGNGDAPQQVKERLSHYGYRLRQAVSTLDGFRHFLDGSATQAVRQRFYFLTGAGGTGKTHLCLDAADRALQERRPALVLFGGRFGIDDLWASFCEQLGLPPVGAEILLGALEAAAQASAVHGRRFVVMIDALNDTKTQDYWADRLPALMAEFAQRPLLALLVSCRDTYLDYVDPENRRADFEHVHPGFTGREFEATQKYFAHYNLEAPRIPLLLPEFTIPLFLLTYCEGLQGEGLTVPPPGHEGRIVIFERFLKVSLERVRRKLRLSPGTNTVRAALDALLDEMSATGRESVAWQRAEQLATAQIPARTEWPDTALGALLSQGLLSDEILYEDDQPVRSVRITYQAFSDFLILERQLAGAVRGSPPDAAFADWLRAASRGIRDAAAIVLPERYAIELPDLLEPLIRGDHQPDSPEGRRASYLMSNLDQMTVRSLPYRSAGAITERSFEILNRHAVTRGGERDALSALFLSAAQPDSPLNGDEQHRWLSRFSMAQRDAAVGLGLYDDLDDEASPLSRLARWAAAGPYPTYERQVVELACVPLVWVLSSPNRFVRDWITKALARLLAGHLDVAASLIERFATVNDPYVLERLVTVVYGSVLRGGLDHLTDAAEVAGQVERLIFRRLDRLNPDALMLDAARGIIEWAVARGLLAEETLEVARPPYGLSRPGNPPTWQRLEERYPHGKGTTDETNYGSVFFSLHGLADFGRYVVETGLQHFAKTALSEPLPAATPPGEPRFLKTRWAVFVKTLSPEQTDRAAVLMEATELTLAFDDEARQFLSELSDEQHDLLSACWQRPKRRILDLHYPSDRARRWVTQRTMTLGWTPKLFGQFDRYLNYGRVDRGSHKAERFGKKYQWIAYHELLARVADNYHYHPGYGEESRPFGGIWEINDREIDPSLPPVPYREFQERIAKQGTWQPSSLHFPEPPPGSVDFDNYGGDSEAFLSDRDSLPYPDQIARLTDEAGQSWILLDAGLTHTARPDRDDGDQWADRQFYSFRTWLVAAQDATVTAAALPAELRRRSFGSDLVDSQGHTDCCYFGELGWRDMDCPNRHAGPLHVTSVDETTLTMTPTTERYTWEGSIWDCSIEESAHAALPSAFLQGSSGVRWSGNAAEWHDGDELVMSYLQMPADNPGSMLVVNEEWLRSYLSAQGMALVLAVHGERDHRDGPSDYSWTEFSLSGVYDAGQLTAGPSQVTPKSTAGAAGEQEGASTG
jgi:hypothetical protein